jgi:uncharacterized membrane protein
VRAARTRAAELLALAILAGAAYLRLHDLGRRSLWLDEAWAAVGALDGSFDVAHVRTTPLLFAGLVRLAVAALGRTEVAVRLPAALASLAAVVLAWRLGRRLAGDTGGCVAAAILGLLPIPIYYGKELKHYAVELCLALVLALVVERLRRTPRWAPGWVVLVLGVALGAGLSPIAPLLVAGAFVVLLPVAQRAPAWLLGSAVACGLAGVAWLRLVFASQLAGDANLTDYWHLFFLPPESGALTSAVEAATWGLGTALPHHADSSLRLASLPPAAMYLAAAATVAGAVVVWRRGGAWFVVLALSWHVLAAAAAAAGRYPYGPARIALYLLGPTAILLGAAASGLTTAAPLRLRPVVWLLVVAALAPSVRGAWEENVAHPFEREELRPVLEAIAARRQPGDATWVSPGATSAYRFYVPAFDPSVTLALPSMDVGTALAAAATRGHGRVWAVFGHRVAAEQPRVLESLGRLRVADHVEATSAAALLLVTPEAATPPPG